MELEGEVKDGIGFGCCTVLDRRLSFSLDLRLIGVYEGSEFESPNIVREANIKFFKMFFNVLNTAKEMRQGI